MLRSLLPFLVLPAYRLVAGVTVRALDPTPARAYSYDSREGLRDPVRGHIEAALRGPVPAEGAA